MKSSSWVGRVRVFVLDSPSTEDAFVGTTKVEVLLEFEINFQEEFAVVVIILLVN